MTDLFVQPTWLVISLLLTVTLVVMSGALAYSFDVRRSRLPEATSWEDLSSRRTVLAAEVVRLQEKYDQLTRQIQERDRVGAEVLALQEQLESLKLEVASLDESRRQVEEMKANAAKAATDLATVQVSIDAAARELAALGAERDDVERQLSELRKEIGTLPVDIERLMAERQTLENEAKELRDEVAHLRAVRGQLREVREEVDQLTLQRAELEAAISTLPDLREELDQATSRLTAIREDLAAATAELYEAREEVVTLMARKEHYEGAILELARKKGELAGTEEQLTATRTDWAIVMAELQAGRGEVAELRAQKGALDATVSNLLGRAEELRRTVAELEQSAGDLADAHRRLQDVQDETASLVGRQRALLEKIADLEERLRDLEDTQSEVKDLKAELAGLLTSVQSFRHERSNLIEEIDQCRARLAALKEALGAEPPAEEDGALEDLRRLPLCLVTKARPKAIQLEEEALNDVITDLKNNRLLYDDRTVRAFHTALKVNDTTQMTVLAGVSGTGKSLLPRRYAHAMGIRFLQIAVEPRWDSPQDLLGFYNYIEKKYRGTELARALVQMDPFNTSGLSGEPFADEILLVLLDEMNLARVEYYFSEFLSRLEVRPRLADVNNEEQRRGAFLPIDIRGRKDGPIRLFPSHNVLFAGTMNDDESTQALSDKVLDRANVMQFAAPSSFSKAQPVAEVSEEFSARSFGSWKTWIRPAAALAGSEREKVERVISRLAGVMNEFGRPFGHRLNEAMLTYAANYPRAKGRGVEISLADQIEFRILPKLRGLTIEDHLRQFETLGEIVRQDLVDPALSETLGELVERQRSGAGQFNWRGINRDQQ